MKTYVHICPSVHIRMIHASDKSCRENQNIFYILITFFEILAVYEIMWENVVQPDRPQMTM